jgi:peptidoglycan/LPS O-acetylase OafA/YrhL
LYLTATLPGWQVIAMHFAFLQNFNQGYASALNGVYWTLPTEFGYYLLLPLFALLAALFGRYRSAAWRVLSIMLIAFAIAYRVLAFDAISEQDVGKKFFTLLQLPGLIDHFAIGMMLAWVYVRYAANIATRWADAMMLTGLLGIVTMMASLDNVYLRYWNGHFLLFVGYTITACFIGLLVLGVATAGPKSISCTLFANTSMLFLGVVSYSLYLWHVPIQQWTMKLLDYFAVTGDRLGWLLAISLPLSILAAAISYYLIERPFLSRGPKRPR